MARLIYALKIFIFRESGFKLTKREESNIANFCVFGIAAYVKPWFLSRLPTSAPASYLQLFKVLFELSSPAATGALKKLCGQLWYLSEELVAFAFFDRETDAAEKLAMVAGLIHNGRQDPPKRISIDLSAIP
jgi:hypothetical protein